MEHSRELEELLLKGLPDRERKHVVNVIEKLNAEKLRRTRSRTTPGIDKINLADLSLDDEC